MTSDTCTPLASLTQLRAGGFADLVRAYTDMALTDILIEATRACETACARRFVPFTITETSRADGIDPDEMSGDDIPMDIQGSLGRSYAAAIGSSGNLVRHFWVSEFAPHYPEFWSYSGVSVSIVRSFGGGQQPISNAQLLSGPDPDSGHVWFTLGTYLPIGSLISVTYSGGYSTVPADLRRACLYMAAAIVARELDPLSPPTGHTPDALEGQALEWLSSYQRS